MHSRPSPKGHTFSLVLGASSLLALLAGCPISDLTLPGINQDPTANAGADRTIDVGQRVTLNALGSTDADDDALTFAWQQRSGPPVALDGANTPQPSFVPVEAALYEFALTVTDDRGGSDISVVRVFVGIDPPATCPHADAGTDQTVNEGAAVRLRGANSADPGGGPLTFDWFQLSGPQVSINGVFIADPSFAAPQVTGADVELEFELTVTNEHGCPDRDTLVITVRDRDPGDPCNGVVCNDDGLFCNGVEFCDDGACSSSGDPCAAAETCDEATESCIALPDCATDTDCDDGVFCNGTETCVDEQCQVGATPCAAGEICDEDTDLCMPATECVTDVGCDDGNHCTDDSCLNGECIFENNAAECDDGDACTEFDVCTEGSCAGTVVDCGEGMICRDGICAIFCLTDSDCDDGLFCDGTETCVDGFCHAGTTPCAAVETCDELNHECTPSGPTVFFDDFEGGIGNWFADNGIWEVGVPTSGPNSAYSGVALAATVLDGDYPGNSSRLVSPSIQLPAILAGQELHLRLWHWFNFAGSDTGVVQVREEEAPGQWGAWTSLNTFSGSSGVYTNTLVDLSAFAGKKVQIGFRLSNPYLYNAAGWYVDDVSIEVF